MKKLDTLSYLNIMEKISLEVLSERFVGELDYTGHSEFEKECLKRLNAKYSEEEIIKLKQNVPSNPKAPHKTQIEILKDLIEFRENIYLPNTSDLRQKLMDQYSQQEKAKLSEIRGKYLTDLERHFSLKSQEIVKDENLTQEKKVDKLEQNKLQSKLDQLIPKPILVWDQEDEHILYLSNLTKKYMHTLEPYAQNLIDLKKNWFKIWLGRFGNFVGTIMHFDVNKEPKRNVFFTELLLVK